MQSLSSFIRTAAENGTDGRIDAPTKATLAAVMLAERAYDRAIGPVAAAWQSVLHAFGEVARADATVEVYRRWLAVNPDEPRVIEAYRRAAADAIEASHWLADCLERHRWAMRQAAGDAETAA